MVEIVMEFRIPISIKKTKKKKKSFFDFFCKS